MRVAEWIAAADVEVVPGVTANTGAALNDRMIAFLRVLRARTSAPIHVNSGERDALEQAQAMLTKLAAGGAGELRRLYRDDQAVEELLHLPRTADAWASRIQALAEEGRMLSRHMRGAAVDLRTRGLTADQVEELKAAVRALGGRTLQEGAPPHLHVDLPAVVSDETDDELPVVGWSWGRMLAAGAVVGVVCWVGAPVLWPWVVRSAAVAVTVGRRLA